MSQEPQIFVGQLVTLTFTIKNQDAGIVDLSIALTRELVFKHPGAAPLVVTATLVTDGTDGKVKYTTLATDLSIPGIWKVQADIAVDANNSYPSTIAEFEVFPNLRK